MDDLTRHALNLRANLQASAFDRVVDAQNPRGEFWTSTAERAEFAERPATAERNFAHLNPAAQKKILGELCAVRQLAHKRNA
jgi:hypothetical protein